MPRRRERSDPLDGACERLLAAPPDGQVRWRMCVELQVLVKGLERLLQGSKGAAVTLSLRRIATPLMREAPRCYELVRSGRARYAQYAMMHYAVRVSGENGKYVLGRFNHKWVLTLEGARRVLEIARAQLRWACPWGTSTRSA